MLSAPWIKRIELQTGAKTSMPLRREEPFSTAFVTDADGREFAEHVICDGVSWFHVARTGKRWLLHGSVMSSGSALYVFMEHPEARHPELEAAISREAGAAEVYADWLEEQGDPFAGALKPELAKERGPAGLWWLEGFERSGAVTTTVRNGFVREVQVGAIPATELLSTVHRLCHLRACLRAGAAGDQSPFTRRARLGFGLRLDDVDRLPLAGLAQAPLLRRARGARRRPRRANWRSLEEALGSAPGARRRRLIAQKRRGGRRRPP